MLTADQIQELMTARHRDPFAVLGLHADTKGKLWIRACLPGAASVFITDAVTAKPLVNLTLRHRDGLFEACIPRRRKRFDYRLAVRWADKSEETNACIDIYTDADTYADAYAYGPQLSDENLYALNSGTHLRPYEVLGAHPQQHVHKYGEVAGVRFAIWAPNATRVSVVGEFNNWDGRRHPMRLRHQAGVWEIFIPHVGIGDCYKFELVDTQGDILPLKSDPYAFAAELRPDTASRIAVLPSTKALAPSRAGANHRQAPVSIYEVHPGSWRFGVNDPIANKYAGWDELAESLPAYAADLGFTHIELMPISEYPFDGSWGYQTLGLYALTARFGPPAGFARFVNACHAHGLGVLLDWVPAHFPADAHGLAQFDGTSLYEYADPREGFHRDWNTLIYNFGRNEVRNFLAGNALFWMERYGVDGLRVDAVASMLYRDYSRPAGEWIPNVNGGRENLEAISLLQRINEIIGSHAPGAITLAEESTAYPGVSAPTFTGGLGFHYKWNMGWMNDTLAYMHEDPIHRRFHHQKMSFGLVYAFSENFVLPISHDEVVHGKGSMLQKMPGDEWQKFANLRAYYGFMWGHPGKKLLFMGQEFAQANEWNHDAELPWGLLNNPLHAGVQKLVRDLNRLYCAHPALHRLDCEASGFEWLVSDDAAASVFAWLRCDGPPDKKNSVIVVSHFTPVPRNDYRLGVPAGVTAWVEALNTDSAHYGGSNLGNGARPLQLEPVPSHGHAQSIRLNLPPLATLFLVAVDSRP